MLRCSYCIKKSKKKSKKKSIKKSNTRPDSYRIITDDEASDKLFAVYSHIKHCKKARDDFKTKALHEGKTEEIATAEACRYFGNIVIATKDFVNQDILPIIDMHIYIRHNNAEKWHKIIHFRDKYIINDQIAEIYSIFNMIPFIAGVDVSDQEARCKLFALYAAWFPFPQIKQNQNIIDKNKSIINVVREWADPDNNKIIWGQLPLEVDDQELNDKIGALYYYLFHTRDTKKERDMEGGFLDYIRLKNKIKMRHFDWNTMKCKIKWNDIS